MTRINKPPAPDSDTTRIDHALGDTPVVLSKSLHTGMSTATECLVDLAKALRGNDAISLSSARSLMRTALMGAGRSAFVLLPDSHDTRVEHAGVVVRQEWNSLERATDALSKFTQLRGLVPPEEFRDEMRRKSVNLPARGNQGEERTIRRMCEVVAERMAAGGYSDDEVPSEVLTEGLVWIWHSASGSAHAFGWPRLAGGDFVSDLGMVVPIAHFALNEAIKRWL